VEDGGRRDEIRTAAARGLVRWIVKHQDQFNWHAGRLQFSWGKRGTQGVPSNDALAIVPNEP
jgi:hypothetical protein